MRLRTVSVLLGMGLLVIGAALIYRPLGLLVMGALLLLLASPRGGKA